MFIDISFYLRTKGTIVSKVVRIIDIKGVRNKTIVKLVKVARNLPSIASIGVRKLKRVNIS